MPERNPKIHGDDFPYDSFVGLFKNFMTLRIATTEFAERSSECQSGGKKQGFEETHICVKADRLRIIGRATKGQTRGPIWADTGPYGSGLGTF